MDAKVAEALRKPFPPEYIGKLPRVTCGDCSDRSKNCSKHNREKCNTCGSYVSTAHIHLDYVGHADVTARLLEADPAWTWEPVASDEHGLPLCDVDNAGRPVGLWIRLTVGDVSRLGYGSCPSSQGDAVKVLIGDALRNAAMRFGVAVDLWAKGDRLDPTVENATAASGQAAKRQPARRQQTAPVSDLSAARAEMIQTATAAGLGSDPATIGEHFQQLIGKSVPEATVDEIKVFVEKLREDTAKRNGQTEQVPA